MKKPEIIRKEKDALLEDMLASITYTPNREQDILAFMEQYLKADTELRPSILECLHSCMNGKQYPDPYAGSYHYTAEDVSAVGEILDGYAERIASAEGDPDAVSECAREAVCQLNELNDQCGGCLIDTWRRERLCGFINTAAEAAGFVREADLTFAHRMW